MFFSSLGELNPVNCYFSYSVPPTAVHLSGNLLGVACHVLKQFPKVGPELIDQGQVVLQYFVPSVVPYDSLRLDECEQVLVDLVLEGCAHAVRRTGIDLQRGAVDDLERKQGRGATMQASPIKISRRDISTLAVVSLPMESSPFVGFKPKAGNASRSSAR